MRKLARIATVLAAAVAASACGSGSRTDSGAGNGGPGGGGGGTGGTGGTGGGGTPAPAPVVLKPPVVDGALSYHSVDQGLPADVRDVSPDEAGNVYVAAVDAVLAKRRDDAAFTLFPPAAAGLTRNCDAAGTRTCALVSVAGAAPGVAYVGLQGVGTDGDDDPDWMLDSGGADQLAFDGAALRRTRHVQLAGAPHQMCMDHSPPPCSTGDATYEKGRRKVRQVLRIAVNHRAGTVHHGDVWFAGTHGSFSLLVASPERRGWVDLTRQFPGTEDRQFVWEHDHPAMYQPATIGGVKQWAFLTGQSTAIAVDPTTGDPWAANETRTARKAGYGATPDGWDVAMWPPYDAADERRSWLDVWPDPLPSNPLDYDALDPSHADLVTSLSFCDDGTLWIASAVHGLARRAPGGGLSYVSLPDGTGNAASAVACDPGDGSVWVGFGWGGFGRWDGTSWSRPVPATAPWFASWAPVSNIQIDRWASPRIVYVAHQASRGGPGGVTVYRGR